MRRLRPAVGAVALATVLALMGSAVPAAHAGTVPNDPWGPYGWDAEHGRFHQPILGTPVPAATPLGQYDDADFDGDGVSNRADNCLLVPNAAQTPATKPTGTRAVAAYEKNLGPTDLLAYSKQWKAENPTARFLDDAELGEGCSGYNTNYLRTTGALVHASNTRKLEIFKYLGQSGPMFGGAANPFPSGKPTSYSTFGMAGGSLTPDPTQGADLAQDADGTLATGNLTPSAPMCSGYDQAVGFVRWLTGTEKLRLLDAFSAAFKKAYEQAEDKVGCNSGAMINLAESPMMDVFWAGKRLYTNAEGGRITNRFVSALSENPLLESLIHAEPFRTLSKASGLFPYADDAASPGQSRHGIIFRGKSYLDGNDTILMDWRGFDAAWPLGPGPLFGPNAGMLIYDECRAIQTGVYNCTAVTDWKIGPRRHTFQEGYMPWVTKGPPSIAAYQDAIR